MSRYWDDPKTMETRIWRAVCVGEYTDASAMEYLRASKHGTTQE